ncbi:hypothetical protein [Massilia atriviolacea]|uniref:hypothetical protein n=1 Tax=Massilia atriviolacea TaxID=2495579 RepID=UPI001E52F28E|nr:hypothetical protein [Massilia atriviolacea]
MSLGTKDFLTKPFDLIETMLRIWNLLETSLLYKRLQAFTAPRRRCSAGIPGRTAEARGRAA